MNSHFNTGYQFLLAGFLIVCFMNLGNAECPPGQIFHFNPATNIGVCCIPRSLPIGYGFKSCTENGTQDMIEECQEGFYQPDNTTTKSEAKCFKNPPCNQEDNVISKRCNTSGQNCVNICVCNYERGYCGKDFFNCNRFPQDCPLKLVQMDCSCQRNLSVTPLPDNASNKPGPVFTTTPSTVSANRGAKAPAQNSNATNFDGALDNGNGTGGKPDQTESTVLGKVGIAIGLTLGVGIVAVVVLVCIFRRSLKRHFLSIYRNFCHCKKSANIHEDSVFLDSVLTSGPAGSGREQRQEEAQQFLSGTQSEGCHGDQNIPICDQDKMRRQVIDTAGPFCKGCGSHQKRCKCNKLVKEQSLARVKPQQGVNGIGQTSQLPGFQSNESWRNEISVDGYSSFSPSIYDNPESYGGTNEETALLKPISTREEAECGGQETSSIVQHTNQVEGTRFEVLGVPSDIPYRRDSHSDVMNHNEQELTFEIEDSQES